MPPPPLPLPVPPTATTLTTTTTTTTTATSSPVPIPIRLNKPVPPLPPSPSAMTISNMHPSSSTASTSSSSTSTSSASSSQSRRRPSADHHHSHHHHHFFPSRSSSSAHSHKLSSSPSSSPMLMFRSIVAVVKDKFSSSSSHDRSHGSPGSDSGLSSTPPHTMSSISASSLISQSETSISTIGSSRSIPLSQSSARRPSADTPLSSSSFSFAALSSPPTSPAPLVRAIPLPPGSPKPTGAPLASLDGIPDLVRESFAYIERHGSTVEGIYRTACPGADLLAEWATQFDSKSGRRMVPRDLDAEYAPDAVAQAVKNYFKALPEEVISARHVVGIWDVIQAEKQRAAGAAAAAGTDELDSGTEEDAAAAAAAASAVAKKATISAIRSYVRANLIHPHRLMLAAVLRHLQVMARHADKTRVTAKTLSMLWPAVLCCPHAAAHAMEVLEEAMFLKAQAPGPFEWLIENAKEVTVGW